MKQIEKRNWNFNNASLAYTFAIVGYFCASIILTIVVLSSTPRAISNANEVNETLSKPWVTYLNIILSELSFFLVFLICNKKFKKETLVASRIKFKPDALILVGTILGAGILFFGSMNISELFTYLFSTFAKSASEISVPLDTFGQFLIAVFLLAILPAICEEFLFRGIIFHGLKSKFKGPWAIVLSALLFALIHMSIYQTLHQFVLGVVLATLAYFTGTLAYGMVLHFLNNFFVVFLSYVFPNTNFVFTTWGAKEVLLSFAIFILAVLIVSVLFYFLRKKNKKQAQNLGNSKQFSWQEIIAENQQLCDLYEISDEENLPVETGDKLQKGEMARDKLLKPLQDNTLGIILLCASIAVATLMWVLNSF